MGLEQFTAYSDTVSLNNILFILLSTFSLVGFLSLNRIYFLDRRLEQNFLIIRIVILLTYVFILAAFINFFIPLNDYISLFFYLPGLAIFFNQFFKKQLILEPKWILLSILFIFFYGFNSGYNNDFDYHSHHILLYKNYNLLEFNNYIVDGRVKYNSAYLLLNAITYLSFLPFSVKFLSSFIFVIFILDIRNYLIVKKISVNLKLLSLFFVISVFIVLSKFKNIGTDYIAHIIFLSLLLFYCYVWQNDKKFFLSKRFLFLISITFTFMIVLKISMILSLFIGIHYLIIIYQNKKIKNLLNVGMAPSLLMILLWGLQNIELSKCLIYPISFFCFVDEASMAPIIFEHNMINLFAKSVKINYWDEPIQKLIEFNQFPNWFFFWLNDHFLKLLEKFIPIILIFYLSIFKVIKKMSFSNIQMNIEYPKIFGFVFFIIVIIWFLQAPALRFGFSYLAVGLYFISISPLKIFKFSFIDNLKDNYFTRIVDIFIVLFFIYQILRII